MTASLFFVAVAYARSNEDSAQTELIEKQKKALQDLGQDQQKASKQKEELEKKRHEIRIKFCEKVSSRTKQHHQQIKEKLQQVNQRITRRVERAKTFVSTKNLVVENYDSLLADIIAKEKAAKSSASAVNEAAVGFDCESENVKTQVKQIKEKVAIFKTAALAYKTSVRTFLKAVKAAATDQLQSESVNQNSGGNRWWGTSAVLLS